MEQEAKKQVRAEAQAAHKYFDATMQDITWLEWGPGSRKTEVNAEEVPYIAIPPQFRDVGKIRPGDLALVRYGYHAVYVVVGDLGNDFRAGEASMRTARELGLSVDPNSGGLSG